ncbi:MAG: GDSL-type esterase/lipase family protein [Mycobacteriaceae bacterium]
MTDRRARTKLTKAVAGGVAALGLAGGLALGGVAAPEAEAQTAAAGAPGNIVTFGDSYTSNPDQVLNTFRGVLEIVGDYPQQAGCLQAPNNWPRKVGAKTGAPLSDWSCTGNTSRTMLGRIDHAVAIGDLHGGTRSVVLAVGLNNYGPFGVADGVNTVDPGAVRGGFLADLHAAADKIRAVAPGAQIVVPGTLTIADPGNSMFCPLNVVPDLPAGIPVPLLRDVENWNRQNQIDAAAEIGATYVEVKNGSAGNGTCAPDQQRFVSGVIDTTTPDYNMIVHPSDAGSEFMADRVAGVA